MLTTLLTDQPIAGPPASVGPRNAQFLVDRTHSPEADTYTDLAHAVLVARGRGLRSIHRIDDHGVREIGVGE